MSIHESHVFELRCETKCVIFEIFSLRSLCTRLSCINMIIREFALDLSWVTYRLTHSASELSGFTCTSTLTMNEKFQYRTRPPSAVLKNFEFIVSERVQVNPDNSRAMSTLTFLLFKLNTLQAKIVKF